MAEWVKVANEGEIAPGQSKAVDVNGAMVLILNRGGRYYAIDDVCTHDGQSLRGGEVEGCEIICPRHGARFDIRTGEVMAPPAYEALYVYQLRVRDGAVEILDGRWD